MHIFSSYKMRRQRLSMTIVLFFSIVALFVGSTGNTFAATTLKHVSPTPTCKVVELHLQGKQTPTSRCLSQTLSVTPNTSVEHPCTNPNDLVIYWNSPIAPPRTIPPGPVLCVWGSGDLDLANGNQFDGRNWNDQASAWWAGCSGGIFRQSDGVFYNFINQTFSGGNGTSSPSGNFDGGNGGVANDALTVITLNSNCH